MSSKFSDTGINENKLTWTADEMDAYYSRQRREYAALRALNSQHPAKRLAVARKQLRASNEYVSGTAVFEGRKNLWKCVEADPALAWMKTTPADRLKVELLKRGMRWEWHDVSEKLTGQSPVKTDTHP